VQVELVEQAHSLTAQQVAVTQFSAQLHQLVAVRVVTNKRH
tara:strand:+ start:189 stop:311 length:123 start_codon:yes stop_codon:yes gene_type:complete